MTDDWDGRPRIAPTARTLGVRPDIDIPVDGRGFVEPGFGGMSVSPGSPLNLPAHRRPSEHGGTGKDPVWELAEDVLPGSLVYRSDDDMPDTHGFVEPASEMTLEDYELALAETRDLWRLVR
jgi:hypothetical protein